MIRSFRNTETRRVYEGEDVRSFPPDVLRPARRKLRMIAAATQLDDLRSPPGNRLERLHGDRAGEYSIRINRQYRICFVWREGQAHEVEITDYH